MSDNYSTLLFSQLLELNALIREISDIGQEILTEVSIANPDADTEDFEHGLDRIL